ncbi:ABC transporter ATP-binding protein [Mucilaginibacter sp. HMF5004]|uniref:ABC transporter ATP-binding protein n=1 Tax=Mucilaginibacter rivuli TaxID=2857527 RepID=UPI001C5FBBE0|nr:ABC transporter ATP-binding protein [Mucilaginibacter rivuli]MBW4891708.1 ABC transporter ATP-binding protein [Mucilaginibacter rivuli]
MIIFDNLTFGYKKAEPVLQDLNLELKQGHIYGLLGQNGAGKSSLLYNICGLLFANKGQCHVLGQVPSKRNVSFLQQVFLLPEEFYIPRVNLAGYLNTYAPFYPAFDRDMFYRFAKEFEIPDTGNLQSLSHGEQKKVMISFALATNAKVLLMDEPTNGLDIPSKKQFRKIIAGCIRPDQTMIISTHQVRDLDSLIDHVLILKDKNIIVHEPVDRITEKLVFKQAMTLNEAGEVIYSEGGLKGYAVVALNKKEEPSRLDMEMFFNAVLSNKQQIVQLFNN